jgi:hypothetical protein
VLLFAILVLAAMILFVASNTVLCCVVGLQFGLQTLFTSPLSAFEGKADIPLPLDDVR